MRSCLIKFKGAYKLDAAVLKLLYTNCLEDVKPCRSRGDEHARALFVPVVLLHVLLALKRQREAILQNKVTIYTTVLLTSHLRR
jgi:hypothetical protein